MKRLLKLISENEMLRYDLCSMATIVIAAAILLGIMNLITL
mgnify:CR=1 FL=1